ncbi:MAG: hypothetical protein ACLQVL_29725 [Terriglobia bacterium]
MTGSHAKRLPETIAPPAVSETYAKFLVKHKMETAQNLMATRRIPFAVGKNQISHVMR